MCEFLPYVIVDCWQMREGIKFDEDALNMGEQERFKVKLVCKTESIDWNNSFLMF